MIDVSHTGVIDRTFRLNDESIKEIRVLIKEAIKEAIIEALDERDNR